MESVGKYIIIFRNIIKTKRTEKLLPTIKKFNNVASHEIYMQIAMAFMLKYDSQLGHKMGEHIYNYNKNKKIKCPGVCKKHL